MLTYLIFVVIGDVEKVSCHIKQQHKYNSERIAPSWHVFLAHNSKELETLRWITMFRGHTTVIFVTGDNFQGETTLHNHKLNSYQYQLFRICVCALYTRNR